MNHKPSTAIHISVCICTYKRPQMLSHLLSKLQDQVTENLFTYSAVVVDNDVNLSAKDIVTSWQEKSMIRIDYFCEPQQNIALARNKAVKNAKGNFIAFIDDDEFPENNWLINLLKTQEKYNAAGVLGPVKPHFQVDPPQWIIKSKICERPAYPTGTVFKNSNKTRTGNVLFRRELFADQEKSFNPEFGLTGGEDVNFFSRMIEKGSIFVWCDEACVYEVVSPDRFEKKFEIKRALLRGAVSASKSSLLSMSTFKSTIAFIVYTTALPFLYLFGEYLFMKYLIKDCDHFGKIAGLLGWNIVTKR